MNIEQAQANVTHAKQALVKAQEALAKAERGKEPMVGNIYRRPAQKGDRAIVTDVGFGMVTLLYFIANKEEEPRTATWTVEDVNSDLAFIDHVAGVV